MRQRRLECLSSDDNDDRRTVRSAHRPHCQVPSPWALRSAACSALRRLPITFLSPFASAWPVHAKISNVQWFSDFSLSALGLIRCLARQKKTKISLRVKPGKPVKKIKKQLLYPSGHLFPSNVPVSYILGEECSLEEHVLSFVLYGSSYEM
jgi:hypothetical protein